MPVAKFGSLLAFRHWQRVRTVRRAAGYGNTSSGFQGGGQRRGGCGRSSRNNTQARSTRNVAEKVRDPRRSIPSLQWLWLFSLN